MMGKEWSLKTPLLLSFIALGTVTGQGSSSSVTLTAYPASGERLTLSCTDRNGYDILTTKWLRSGSEIFQTISDNRTAIITTKTSNITIYNDVEGRISVSTSTKQHNVTLKVKASIDNGTVWRCRSAGKDSYNITISVADHKDTRTDPSTSSTGLSFASKYTEQSTSNTGLSIGNSTSSSTNNPSASPRSNDEELSPGFFENTNNIYIIAGAGAGGGAVLIILVIAVIVFVKKWRNKQSTEGETSREADVHVYNTMARDDNQDNQYTELSKENISENNEKTCYYNTVSEAGGHMYENPPLSQTRQT